MTPAYPTTVGLSTVRCRVRLAYADAMSSFPLPIIELVRATGTTGKAYILFRNPRNHETLSVSEAYSRPWSRNRALRKLVDNGGGLICEAPTEVVRLTRP